MEEEEEEERDGQWAYIAKNGEAHVPKADRIVSGSMCWGRGGKSMLYRLARSRCPRDCGEEGVDTKRAKEKRK